MSKIQVLIFRFILISALVIGAGFLFDKARYLIAALMILGAHNIEMHWRDNERSCNKRDVSTPERS